MVKYTSVVLFMIYSTHLKELKPQRQNKAQGAQNFSLIRKSQLPGVKKLNTFPELDYECLKLQA